MSILDIRVLGDPILREDTVPVGEVTDELRALAATCSRRCTWRKALASPRRRWAGRERIAVVDVDDKPLVIINPEIVEADAKTAKAEEGCLSIPEIYGDVERPARVRVRALDLDGKEFEVDADELLARCLQHEIDHLHGKLFIDYLSVLKRRSALAKWAKEKHKYPGFIRTLDTDPARAHAHPDEEL